MYARHRQTPDHYTQGSSANMYVPCEPSSPCCHDSLDVAGLLKSVLCAMCLQGNTALWVAVKANQVQVAELLLARGANVSSTNRQV